MSKVNDENVCVFNTPVKNGATKMTWNSPFQPLNTQSQPQPQPQSQLQSHYANEDYTAAYNEAYNEDYNDGLLINNNNNLNYSDNNFGAGNFDLALNHLPTATNQPAQFNTDIPVLDDLFTELNSDLNYFDPANKSEPVNLEDIERILLPTNHQPARKPIIRQPFSSILNLSTDPAGYNNNISNADYYNNLPTGPFDESLMLWDGLSGASSAFNPVESSQKSLIPLNSQTSSSQIQIKVIGKRPAEPPKTNVMNKNQAQSRIQHIPYVPAPPPSKPMKSYRTYGSKRYIIGPEYADFVSRLQNDIPFDSSEDDEDEQFEKHSNAASALDRDSIDTDDNSDNDSSDEEEGQSVKISSQELLELFEDSCSGLPGLISAFLTHRKHQIGLKGYKPRASTSASMLQSKTASAPPLLTQDHFDRIRKQLSLHFQFLIQNLALANEIEGGEGITLVSLKLLVQLHLSLDSICNLRPAGTNTTGTANSSITSTTSTITSNISCLNLPTPRVNPIRSRLNELIPAGIKKVSIIAGFLVRPGQKQFLSLAALRADSTLKPKTSLTAPPLGLKIKANMNGGTGNSDQLLSNAFYNILALFHDYIDARLLEQTVGAKNLIKHLDTATTLSTTANNTSSESQPMRTAKFLASEDNLLLCGLHRFGCGNWESIQCQFLPFRTARQLAIRYKNLSSRREPMNPIKEFNENLMMPLSEIEEDLLGKGVQRFGNQFHLISKHYLPHRPATVLGKLWKAMDDARTRNN